MEKQKSKSRKMLLALNETLSLMIDELVEEGGFNSRPQAVYDAIRRAHKQTFPAYAQGKRRPSLIDEPEQPTDEEREANKIVELLEGEVFERAGRKYVKYWTYVRKNRTKKEVPYSMLTDALVRNQYYPDRKTVMEIYKEGNATYDITEKL
jgi:Arc/MetJ-type ribon-helix-helix transcriptional regulator